MRIDDDLLLRREIEALAAEMEMDSLGALRLGRKTAAYMKTAAGRIARAAARTESEDIICLAGTSRLMETCARQASMERRGYLPAVQGRPRIFTLAEKMCAGGDRAVRLDDLLMALDIFDETQGLYMDEFWAAPEALRMALCRAWMGVSEGIIRAANERIRAEEWVYSGGTGQVNARSSAFCERALQLAMELEKPDLRMKIEDALSRIDSSAESAVRRAHEARALAIVRLENIASSRRMLENCDWQEIFEKISRTEMLLRQDPEKTYPQMDAPSRSALRRELSHISKRTGLGEMTIARCAVNAAGEFPVGDIKRGVCWWLYDDEGRTELLKRLGAKRRIRPMRPDPKGLGYMGAAISLAIIAAIFAAYLCGSMWAFIPALPLAWRLCADILGRIITRIVRPRHVLRMKYESLPDDRRTLVVIPALISSRERARELCGQLEKLGCLENDPNMDFLLLGDFPDTDVHIKAGDEEILEAAYEAISALNARAGRMKYHYLHRSRRYAASDGIYRGHARKRGALMALGRLMTGKGTDEFGAEDACAGYISGRFRYVVTLDADTAMLPGSAREMVAAMAHPMNERRENRGYCVMQPCVEIDPAAHATAFSRLFSGVGGLSTYSGMISELCFDLTGRGSYCGKGVIDMPAFLNALEGSLDDDRILSHDLIEGILSRAGRINDVAVFEGFPATYGKFCARLERWTRGDWQLLPEIVRPGLDIFDRYRLISNLVESLCEPALFLLFLVSAWTFNRGGFAVAAIFALVEPVISRIMGDSDAFRRGCVNLSVLPAAAYVRIAAIARALYRQFVSGKGLLDWVASADAKGDESTIKIACRAGAILLVPALPAAGWTLPVAALGVLFIIGPGWMREMGGESAGKSREISFDHRDMLLKLGRDTWRFFEMHVTSETNFLPPDNVQIDPPVGIAPRTSPTNVAMYMLSCLSAEKLGYISRDEMISRLSDAAATIEKLEKWNGQLYNWYDIYSLEPLRPRYVSSVDSGNLAAALVLCARAARDVRLSARLEKLARDMDFLTLYDEKRRLFHIGADVEHNRLSQSYYDLLASESRILTFASIMLGQVRSAAWRALGRPASGGVLMSWSGTMFEYLMPALFMDSAPGTLLYESMDGAVKRQIAFGRAMNRPWGVSESGYHAFDTNLSYQYRAFGLRSLSLEGRTPQNVTAPYAACLALMIRPDDASRNIGRMLNLGWAGECGLYEAADFTHEEPGIVKSWMSHHQGMALCAICNCLAENYLKKTFMEIPEARALEMLLNEKPAPRIKLRQINTEEISPRPGRRRSMSRKGRAHRLADTFIMGGAGATAIVTARGDVEYMRHGVWMNRFTGDLLRRRDSINTFMEISGIQARINSPDAISTFEAGRAAFRISLGGVDAEMQMCISPADGALVKRIRLENTTTAPAKVRLTDEFEPALMTGAELRSHPAFFRLFLRADLQRINAIVMRRTGRSPGESHMALFHEMAGSPCERSTIWTQGRLKNEFSAHEGAALDAGCALRTEIQLEPGGMRVISIAAGLCSEENLALCLDNYSDAGYAARQIRLAVSSARSMAEFAGLDDEKRTLVERAAAFITAPRLSANSGEGILPRPEGIPWNLPCVCVSLGGPESLHVLRDIIRMHEYCRALGLEWHLAIIDESHEGYFRPMRDGMNEIIGASHLRDGHCVTVFKAENLDRQNRSAILRSACMAFDGKSPLWAQIRRYLMALEYTIPAGYGDMRPGNWDAGDEGLWEDGYTVTIGPDELPDVPWSNIITGENLGMLITERGGGFIWHKNSRLRRVTNFDNDPMNEGWGLMLYVSDLRRGAFARALPGDIPMGTWRVRHCLWGSEFETEMEGLRIITRVFFDIAMENLRFMVTVENKDVTPREIMLTSFIDWLMGEDSSDAARTRAWANNGAVFAAGGMAGAAYMTSDVLDAHTGPVRNNFLGHGGIMRPDGLMERAGSGGNVINARRILDAGGACTVCFALGVEDTVEAAEKAAAKIRESSAVQAFEAARRQWRTMREKFSVETGDKTLDALINGFFLKQVLDGRVRARAGFYQAGGAYGFRDQLQDMLALLPYDPARVRQHILRCANRQFRSGDVMHWWHEPMTGVRTRISDDMLFLPFVTAAYVKHTGDAEILREQAQYLIDEEIPAEKDDWYGPARPSGEYETLEDHCLRAFRRACQMGTHGLLLMGAGDWNDGMNRVGDEGRGESIWLTMFFACAAEEFSGLTTNEADRKWLLECAGEARNAVENSGWDGKWYLRAYDDDGNPIGSRENDVCRIDLLSQAWSSLANMDSSRARTAMKSAREMLVDTENRLIKLLTPPFVPGENDPGYIAAYPAGVRENGGQYTHAACWYLMAQAKLGNAEMVREAISLLLPMCRPENYRAEPYVLAGDVYGEAPYAGRAGWPWYTGSASWFITAIRYILGFEKTGEKVRMNALRGVWKEPQIQLKHGSSTYTLISKPDARETTLDGRKTEDNFIPLIDDGRDHTAIFPQRT